ncbi:RHS repeat-associated core domain-containing protein, partial [bacterium]|nr:RHS repeat-associated core domain-containing protein [bacterium]
YALQDANWNTTAIIAATGVPGVAAGAIINRFAYTPYGESQTLTASWASLPAGSTPAVPWYHLFQGLEFTDVTALAYVRHRDYSASLGRFIELDPIGFSAGDNNLYRFVGNKPTGRVDPFGLFGISIQFNAFIPKSKGVVIHGVGMPGVNWGVEPGQLPLKSRNRYFSTDNREYAGQAGTSRLKLSGKFDSCDVGSLQPLSGKLFTASSDPSHQLEANNGGLFGPEYVAGTLKEDTSIPSKIERAIDTSSSSSGITVGASGGYPFKHPLGIKAPKIDFGMSISATRNADGSVRLSAVGSHNEFPAYEIIVNGKVVYKDYPTASGPGIFNLGLFSDSFRFQITIDRNGVVRTK